MEANLIQNGPLSILKLQGRFFTESDREHAIGKLDLVDNWNLVIDLSELEYIILNRHRFFSQNPYAIKT